jgi:hypothetical protein
VDTGHTILLELTEEKVPQWEALENIRVAHQIKIAAEAAVDKDFTALAEAAEAAEIGAQVQAQMVEDMADLVQAIVYTEQVVQLVLTEQAEAAVDAKKVLHQDMVEWEPV